jgi:acetyl esterase/lipase
VSKACRSCRYVLTRRRTDPLRDEALIYEALLRDAGMPTKMEVYTGLPHGAPDFFPMHSVAKKALVDLKEGLGWILQQKSS